MSLAAWAPALVMLFAVLLAGGITVWAIRRLGDGPRAGRLTAGNDARALRAALHDAESRHPFLAVSPGDLDVHMKPVARLAPASYREGARDIPRSFGERRVVSVDLGRMSAGHGARLVDFCSGYLTGTPGWVYMAADHVIVLTPSGHCDE